MRGVRRAPLFPGFAPGRFSDLIVVKGGLAFKLPAS
jgi:hypothetical protein